VTWQRLLNMTREPGKWELYASGGQPAAKPDPRCMAGRVLCVSKTSRTLRWMIDGRTVSTMDVRFGSQTTPTREGVFSVSFKSRHHVSTIYDSPMPYAMFFSGGQAVHYSSDFAATGYYGASHGCVNVRDEGKIAALFAQVRSGDKVVVHW
jgi:lipoprotein-anchoring transpeptidase ErfK/SrfK